MFLTHLRKFSKRIPKWIEPKMKQNFPEVKVQSKFHGIFNVAAILMNDKDYQFPQQPGQNFNYKTDENLANILQLNAKKLNINLVWYRMGESDPNELFSKHNNEENESTIS